MIEITHTKRTDDTPYCLIHAKGHAGYAEYGKDIVCAGVSTLLFTFAVYAAEQADGKRVNIETDLADGDMSVAICGADMTALPVFEQAYDTIMSGLRLLEVKYPDYIKIIPVM